VWRGAMLPPPTGFGQAAALYGLPLMAPPLAVSESTSAILGVGAASALTASALAAPSTGFLSSRAASRPSLSLGPTYGGSGVEPVPPMMSMMRMPQLFASPVGSLQELPAPCTQERLQAKPEPAPTQRNLSPQKDTFLMALSGTVSAPPVPPSRTTFEAAAELVWEPASQVNPPEAPLPVGWEAVVDEGTGDTYYWDTSTGATQWEHPGAGAGVVQGHAAAVAAPQAAQPPRPAVGAANSAAGAEATHRGAMEARLQELLDGQRALLRELSATRAQASSSSAELVAWRQHLQHMQAPSQAPWSSAGPPPTSRPRAASDSMQWPPRNWTSSLSARDLPQVPTKSPMRSQPPTNLGYDRDVVGLGRGLTAPQTMWAQTMLSC